MEHFSVSAPLCPARVAGLEAGAVTYDTSAAGLVTGAFNRTVAGITRASRVLL